MPFKEWSELKVRFEEEYDRDNMEQKMAELQKQIKPVPLLNDLKDTIGDVKQMFVFLR